MARKLFIVARGNDHLFRTLSSALRNELDVEIIFDRRKAFRPERRDSDERRRRWDVDERIRTEGYAVVRSSGNDRSVNIRWF